MARTDTMVDRRAEIIAAAIRVLARDGITETTTRKIAAEATVNQATLRYYFGSKDDLLFAVLQEMIHSSVEIAGASISIGLDLQAAISQSIKAFWAHVEATPELQVMQYELTLYALRNANSAWLAKQQYEGYSSVVEDLLQQGFAAAGRTHPGSLTGLARFIISGLDGLILQFVSDQDIERARNDLDYLIAATIALTEQIDHITT